MTVEDVSPQRRLDILDALRRGAVPAEGLDVLAVGLDRFDDAVEDELERVQRNRGAFKAVRGEYGTGKTFFSRWLQEQARKKGFVTTEVQVSESQTRLHKMETVYRAAMQRLRTDAFRPSAFSDIVDRWLYEVRREAKDRVDPEEDSEAHNEELKRLLEKRLSEITRSTPQFAAALRGYRQALAEDDIATAQSLLG
ncbi:MAG: BREX system ATP-binding domain-containing protein, partial [Bradymonadaceae bacterium]